MARGENLVSEDGISQEDLELEQDPNEIPPDPTLGNPFISRNRNPPRPSQYKHHFQRFGLNDSEYPVEPKKIADIEKKLKLRINVFSFSDEEGKARYPYYCSEQEFKREVNLLYWHEHYALITNFSSFLSDITRNKNKKYFCTSCFKACISKETLQHHKAFCYRPNFMNQILTLPPEGSPPLEFKNFKYQSPCPFVIYADFECLTMPYNEQNKKTEMYQHHIPISIGYKIVYRLTGVTSNSEPVVYTGTNCVDWFLDRLKEEEIRLVTLLTDDKRLKMKLEDQRCYDAATRCYICHKDFSPGDGKVRDHDHITGRYRGAAHNSCNVKLRKL